MSHWKNALIKKIVRTLSLFQSEGEKDHFLIVSTTGLGDTLWATPALRALREAYPEAYIGCLTTPLGAAVLKNNPHLNERFILTKPCSASFSKLYFQLKKRNIGNVLLFHTSQRIVLPLCTCIGASRRIGTTGLQKGLDDLLTQSLPWESGHEIERRLDIVREVGAHPTSAEMEFFIEDLDRSIAQQIVPEGFVIGLHPGAKDQFKQWPLEYFVKVGQKLREELGCSIVITGTASEQKLAQTLCRQIEGAKPILQPLHILAAILEKLSLFITNDTGPLHLALAMKTPTLSLFTPTNPATCGPYQISSAQVLHALPTCSPCLKKKCRDPFCLRQITPEAVISAALNRLQVSV